MFQAVKGYKKVDLEVVVKEIGETIPTDYTVGSLKDIIVNSNDYKQDPSFVIEILSTTVAERKELEKEKRAQELEKEKRVEEKEKLAQLQEKEKFELEKKLEHEERLELKRLELNFQLELAKTQSSAQNQGEYISNVNDSNNSKRKFTLPKLEFRQFDGDLKEWLPFWSQFKQIHTDEDIEPENKFQYLIQATVIGSRAREVVNSFPPTAANYAKAIESLKARFGREDLLVEVYVRELLKLIISVQSRDKLSLTSLYDKLESYLRALETLGVTTDKCASILYPMVESCFNAEFLKAWNRTHTASANYDAKERLDNLMSFLKGEVEGDERINLAMTGFGLAKKDDDRNIRKRKSFTDAAKYLPTAATLLSTSLKQDLRKNCVFCNGRHLSSECFSARKMSFTEKQNILKDKRCCFLCFSAGHTAKYCKAILKCFICDRKHASVMCQMLDRNKLIEKKEEEYPTENEINMSNFNRNPKVFLQTLKAKIISDNKKKDVRLILDSGSQRSYILKQLAEEMKYLPLREEKITHSLFGGVITKEYKHNYYKIRLSDLKGKFRCNFEVLDQNIICENVMPVGKASWFKELSEKDITLTDVGETPEAIQVLIGADVMGKLLTGRREVLSSGLVALETYLGWTLMGKVPQNNVSKENLAVSVTSMFVKEAGITAVPWAEDPPTLPDNLSLAKKRSSNVTNKLLSSNLYEKYEKVLKNTGECNKALETSTCIEDEKMTQIEVKEDKMNMKREGITKQTTANKSKEMKKSTEGDKTCHLNEESVMSEADTTVRNESSSCCLKQFCTKSDGIMSGSAFRPEIWEKGLCQCLSCMNMYRKYQYEFPLNQDDTNCSYEGGYVPRQALSVCITCSSGQKISTVCLDCSYKCHDVHEIVELYTKRNFRCDCGNSKFADKTSFLNTDKEPLNSLNRYSQKFRVLYCRCSRPYPDLEDNTPDEMMQCVMCEDWYHGRYIGVPVPDDYFKMICSMCMKPHNFMYVYQENWSVFVRNRGQEIRNSSDTSLRKCVHSEINPTDILSRGCKVKHFLSIKWWERRPWFKYIKEVNVAFDDVKGVEEAKQELRDIVEVLRNPEKFSALGKKLPKGVLLVGPPGTDETLQVMRAVTGQADVPFFHAAGPELKEILVVQGACRVRDLFSRVKLKALCVIFIDETVSVGAKRGNSLILSYANQINQLLTALDRFHHNEVIIVLRVANQRDDLDKALHRPRRFYVEINATVPDLNCRKEDLKFHIGKMQLANDIDAEIIAIETTGFTRTDVENRVNQAAIDKADAVSMSYLKNARDKVLTGPQRILWIPDEQVDLPWWRCKKWALHILCRVFDSYGNPANVTKDYEEVNVYYLKAYPARVSKVLFKLLVLSDLIVFFKYRRKVFVIPHVLQLTLSYVSQMVSHAYLLCCNENDEELWNTDTTEYLMFLKNIFHKLLLLKHVAFYG